ncbi:MAG: hypothetical protein ACI93T_003069 [Porticoccaceae bacterium]|jgi:hypothetical protein
MNLHIENLRALAMQWRGRLFAGSRMTTPVLQKAAALDINESGVTVTVVQTGSETPIEQQFQSAWPDEIDWQVDAEGAGKWLGQQLQTAGLAVKDCVLLVPRRDVTSRLLELPNVDDDELVSLVRLQAESKLTQPIDSVVVDFVPLLSRSDDSRDVVLLTTSHERLLALTNLAEAAGLNPVSAVAAELAIPMFGPRADGEFVLDAMLGDGRAALSLSIDGRILSSITISLPESDDVAARQIAASSSRLAAALPETFRHNAVKMIRVYSNVDTSGLRLALAMIVQCPVTNGLSDGINTLEKLRAVAAIAGQVTPEASHDFIRPRQPVDRASERRNKVFRWASAAMLLVGLFAWWLHEENGAAADRIVALQQQERQLGELIERGHAVTEMRSFVSEWQSGAVNWTQELIQFADHLPSTDRVYLTRLQLELEAGGTAPVIRAAGVAREERDVMSLNERLLDSQTRYELSPHGIEPNLQDRFYKSTFQIETRLLETGLSGNSEDNQQTYEPSEPTGRTAAAANLRK